MLCYGGTVEHNGGTVEQRCRKSRSSDGGAVVEQSKRDGEAVEHLMLEQ